MKYSNFKSAFDTILTDEDIDVKLMNRTFLE
jgi:hypothetical protein